MDKLNKKRNQIFSLCLYRWKQRSIKKYTKLWNETKNQIETINGSKTIQYSRYFR